MRANLGFTEENGIYKSKLLSEIDFINHGYTTKEGGVSEGEFSSLNLGLLTNDKWDNVVKNYHIAAEKIGFDAEKVVLTQQVHSDNIKVVTDCDAGKGLFVKSDILETDGLITSCKNLPIGVFTADCTPVLLCDKEKQVVAAVHSGWRGTLMEISKKAVLKMTDEFGSSPENIVVGLGPSIKQCHFEVKEDVYSLFCKSFGEDFIKTVTLKKGDSFYIDTDRINKKSLLSVGIKEENISVCPSCTYCENDKFFSHRQSKGKTGRQCAFIVIK